MKFVLNAHVTFEAEDIDDALVVLGRYFQEVSAGENSTIIESGNVDITPQKMPPTGAGG